MRFRRRSRPRETLVCHRPTLLMRESGSRCEKPRQNGGLRGMGDDQMAATALRLSQHSGLRELGRWVHMLGFRGHFVTKSRRYSITLGDLGATRATYRAHQDKPPDNAAADGTTVVQSVWQYLGSGYLNPATRSWRPASKHPYGPPAKRCSICVVGHRKPST
jgi:hypothetical protein